VAQSRRRRPARDDLLEVERRAVLSVEEVGRLLGLGRSAAYDAARRGEIPVRRVGRRLLVPVPAFLTWLGRTTPVPTEE
jgi:excisionase family DNA binding protein